MADTPPHLFLRRRIVAQAKTLAHHQAPQGIGERNLRGSTLGSATARTTRRRNEGSGRRGGVANPRRTLGSRHGRSAVVVLPIAVECNQIRRRRSVPAAPAPLGYQVPQNLAFAAAPTRAARPWSLVPLIPAVTPSPTETPKARFLVPLIPAVSPSPTATPKARAPAPLTLAVQEPPTTTPSTGSARERRLSLVSSPKSQHSLPTVPTRM